MRGLFCDAQYREKFNASRAVKNIYESACFISGTLIETDNGSVPIEEMLVYARIIPIPERQSLKK